MINFNIVKYRQSRKWRPGGKPCDKEIGLGNLMPVDGNGAETRESTISRQARRENTGSWLEEDVDPAQWRLMRKYHWWLIELTNQAKRNSMSLARR